MSKIRTEAQLQEILDHEFSWRLKEIHDVRTVVRKEGSSAQRTFTRAGVALLYAHWEGFVKASAEAYVNYLSCKGLKYSELQPCLVALGMKRHLHTLAESTRSGAATSALEIILAEMDKPASLPMKGATDTESNLSSAVFINIAGWIGIDPKRYSTKFHLLDDRLLKRRNGVAHGQYVGLDSGDFSGLVDQVLEVMRWFKTDIENALATSAFRRSASAI